MTQKTYYLFALTMPLWLPLAVFPLWRSQSFLGLGVYLFCSLIYGGVPYVVFLIGVLVWARNKTGAAIQRTTVFLPVLFALWQPIALLIFSILEGSSRELNVAPFFLLFALFAFVIGYAYVVIAAFGCAFLKRCGIIRDASIDQPPFISLNL